MSQEKSAEGRKNFFSIIFNSDKEKKQTVALVFLLAILIGIVFLQAKNFQFIGVDDNKYVVKNSHVNTGINIENLKWAFNIGYASNWHPLAWISHMIDVELFGMNAGWHHMTSLFFHFLSAILVFILLKLATGKFWPSAFVSIIFAIHPLRAESVAFVAERKDVLSVFFGLWALIFYVLYSKNEKQKYYFAIIAFFILSLFSKPMLVTLPLIFLLFDYWPLKKINIISFSDKNFKKAITEKIPFFLMSLGVSLITVAAQKNALIEQTRLSISVRIENAFYSYLKYIGKLFWPADLAFPYPHIWVSAGGFKAFLAFIILSAITVYFIFIAKKYRYAIIGWLWFLLTLFPVIGIIQVGSQAMADRFTYFTQIGLLILITWGFISLAEKFDISKKYLLAMGAVAIAVLIPFSIKQVSYWKDVITLFNHSTAVTKNNSMAHNALCVHYAINGELEKGIHHCNESIKIWNEDPYGAENKFNIFFLAKERFINSDDEEIKNAEFIEAVGKMHEKGHDFSKEPENFINFINIVAKEEYDLGIRFIELGKMERAQQALENAIKLSPGYVEALTDLGVLKIGQEKPEESISYFSRATEINPEYLSALYHWGVALRLTGDNVGAKEKIEKVLSIKPGFPPAVAEYKKLELIDDGKAPEEKEIKEESEEPDSNNNEENN